MIGVCFSHRAVRAALPRQCVAPLRQARAIPAGTPRDWRCRLQFESCVRPGHDFGSVAAALNNCLSDGDTADFSRRYFRAAAKKLTPIWVNNRLVDFTVMPADGWRSTTKQLLNWCFDKVWTAAATDIVLTETFVRTLQLLDRPTNLLQPKMLKRVMAGNRRTTTSAATL